MLKYILRCLFIVSTISAQAQMEIDDSIYVAEQWRTYRIYVPEVYDGSQEVPLLLNLHGYGSNYYEQEFYGEFRTIADTANFILVLPNGTLDGFGVRFWNCFAADEVGVDDVQFISQLIDTIISEYTIDQNRMYSTGMSNGGFMSYTLAGELSNRIAAVASVTGSIDEDRFEAILPEHPVPIMEIHGTADFVVPYDGSSDFLPIEEVVNFWVDFNDCNPEPEIIEVPDIAGGDGCTVTHYIYSGGTNNTVVEHYKINGGGHTWPGTIFLLGVTNYDINASKEIWRFLSQYKLDALTSIKEPTEIKNFQISIFPNPAEKDLQILCNENIQINHIEIFDILGKKIIQEKIETQTSITIHIQDLLSGMYLIKMYTSNGIVATQFMKN